MAPPVNSTPADNIRQAAQRQEMDQLQSSFVKIELFEGDSSQDGRQWLERFQYLARFKNLTEAKQLETLPLLFRNSAYDWFEDLEEDTKANLPLLKKAFRKRFGERQNKAIHAENLFKTVQQPGQKVADYLIKIRKLARLADLSEEITLQAAIKGFHPQIKATFGRNAPTTWALLKSEAEKVEENLSSSSTGDMGTTESLVQAVNQLAIEMKSLKVNQINMMDSRRREVHFNDRARSADRRDDWDRKSRSNSRNRLQERRQSNGRNQQSRNHDYQRNNDYLRNNGYRNN